MIFNSEIVGAHWDTWCYCHEGTYYLYYLIDGKNLCAWEGFGVATSKDGVHWTDHGWAMRASSKMVRYFGSGAIWKDPAFEKTGRFICNYSEYRQHDDGTQADNILFAWSTDLIHWEKYDDTHNFQADERYYEKLGRWDCIYAMPRPEGGYWGIWTATPRGNTGNGVGLGFTEDGLNWKSFPAPQIEPSSKTYESGAFAMIGGKIYAMLSDSEEVFLETAHVGCYVADKVEGPYVLSPKNGMLLSKGDSYFSRFFPTPDGLLVNHYSICGLRDGVNIVTYAAPFKRAVVDAEGTLRWLYWEGNEALKGNAIEIRSRRPSENLTLLGEALDLRQGVIAEGVIEIPQDASSCPSGIYVEADGSGFSLRPTRAGIVELGSIDASGKNGQLRKEVDRSHEFGASARFRIYARRGMLELYLDDHFIGCLSMRCPEAKTVSVGIFGKEKSPASAEFRLWQMSL